jgi:hypothetical protein
LKSTFQVFYISSCHRLSWFQTKPSTLYQNITHYNTLMRFRVKECRCRSQPWIFLELMLAATRKLFFELC